MVVSNVKMRESQVVSSQRIQAVNTNAESSLERFKAYAVFQEIKKKLEEDGESFVKKIGGVFAFKVKDGPDGEEATWIVDVKNGTGCVHNDTGKNSKGCVHNNRSEQQGLCPQQQVRMRGFVHIDSKNVKS
ncbi:sterol carrier protein 2-like isoform X2 [Oncorhynchus nerka]|uniref:sterol carrier protein 2-like isoform X2 n=1 Tax=Oncorhynchus nerka TaxID=8023 RepID=UPI0011313523|nr:non-specific lipid-transfer protein-like isoform X2 [Oncorhynchus nerka]XP_029542743.1 non-specific lipid-transfer protein-like isoform X3 [Oncorhynchus nerka]